MYFVVKEKLQKRSPFGKQVFAVAFGIRASLCWFCRLHELLGLSKIVVILLGL